ncbi:MAG: SusC/RagA family TonB-linked outer membrane protein [Prolixibacteraceae bacterium]
MRQNIKLKQAYHTISSIIRKLKDLIHGFPSEIKSNRMNRLLKTNGLNAYFHTMLLIGLIILSSSGWAQESAVKDVKSFKLSGLVRDAISKQPLAAAQITSFNSVVAATTNQDGKFEIELATSTDVLVITAYDYNTREITVNGLSELEIDLYSEAFSSAYTSINGLSNRRKVSQNTAAASQINDLNYLGFASVDDPIQMALGGDVRTIKRSGVDGIGSSFFIRGFNSLNANAQPLFVVDGVIWNNHYDVNSLHDGYFINSLADIDLQDIESVTVVKDGTSIYGSKAANGVILINTKRGKGKATMITFNAMGGITQSPMAIPTMDGDQYRIYVTDLLGGMENVGDFGSHNFLNDNPTNLSYKKYHNVTDWNELLYQQSTTQSYNIGVNGGDDKALYYFSAGYYSNTGIISSTSFNRLNTRFNADFSMTDDVSMGLNIGFSNSDRVLLDDGVNFYTSPTYLAAIKAPFLNPNTYTTAGTLTSDFEDSDIFGVGNPMAVINNALNTSKHNRFSLGIKPAYQINTKLTLSSQFDYSLDKVKETYYSPIVGVADRMIEGYGISENMFRSQQMRNVSIFDDTRLTYLNAFDGVHNIQAIWGWRYLSDYYESDFAEGHNSGTDQKRNLYADEDFKTSDGLNNHIKSISNYLNVDYNYENRYFLTLAAALDGSSRFGRETQGGIQLLGRSWGFFPSANAAWLISSEKFMAGVDLINRLKLRASFGLSGNDDLDPYAWTTYFASSRYIDRGNGMIITNIGNTEVQWETSAKINLGLDANLLNDRLALTIDVYSNHTSNLLSLMELPEVSGNGYYLGNGGELKNTGFELSLASKLVNTKLFKWELSASIGHYVNEIVALPNGDYNTAIYEGEIRTAVGNAAGVFYGYKTNGVMATEAEALAANLKIVNTNGTSSYFTAGDLLFDDLNKDNIIDEQDKQIIGDPNPDIYGSILSKMNLGNLSLNAIFTYSYGNDVYNYRRAMLEGGSELYNQSTAMLDRWTHEGQQTMMPQASFGDAMGNSRFSDRWIEDGSYIKLKSLSLNYKVNLKTELISGLTFSLTANNLFILSNYLGLDPEVSPNNAVLFQGIDTGVIPACKSYLIGIKLNL